MLEILLGNLPPGATGTARAARAYQAPRWLAAREATRTAQGETQAHHAARRRSAKPRAGVGQDPDPVADPAAEQASCSSDDATTIITAATFWDHAEKLNRARPWLAVAREFDVREPIAQNCYRNVRLPPHVGPMAVERFLTLEAADAR